MTGHKSARSLASYDVTSLDTDQHVQVQRITTQRTQRTSTVTSSQQEISTPVSRVPQQIALPSTSSDHSVAFLPQEQPRPVITSRNMPVQPSTSSGDVMIAPRDQPQPVIPSSFSGATFNNCSFYFAPAPNSKKRRVAVIYSDSDSD